MQAHAWTDLWIDSTCAFFLALRAIGWTNGKPGSPVLFFMTDFIREETEGNPFLSFKAVTERQKQK